MVSQPEARQLLQILLYKLVLRSIKNDEHPQMFIPYIWSI